MHKFLLIRDIYNMYRGVYVTIAICTNNAYVAQATYSYKINKLKIINLVIFMLATDFQQSN